MRIFLATLTATVLFLWIPVPRARGVSARAKETLSARQATPKPQPGSRRLYACSEAAGGPLSKPAGGAASTPAAGKEQDRHVRMATQEFCIELDRPPWALEECARKILQETGWKLPATGQEKGGLLATRHLDSGELRRVAQTQVLGEKIHWEEGMANAEIRLIPLSEGITQARIHTRILAKGSTSLPVMRPSSWWPLGSTGALEGDILTALETRCCARP